MINKQIIYLVVISAMVGCKVGTNPSISTAWIDKPVPPSPYPTEGHYNGLLYSQLGQPTGFNTSYPTAMLPLSLRIAYGYNSESNIINLAAFVAINSAYCSATPIKYDKDSNTTFLISAAHCFIHSKKDSNQVTIGDLIPTEDIIVAYGSKHPWIKTYDVKAVYIPTDYCYGSSFPIRSECKNFSPNSGNGVQGNDIAVIQMHGKFGLVESYPKLALESQYPQSYSMAPILSTGYGISTNQPENNANCLIDINCGKLFYVANYQYWKQDAEGFHYLYNSYHTDNAYGEGYAVMFCSADSGGGDLFWDGKDWLLLSEHTYGPNHSCGTLFPYLANAATNVSAYYKWIKSIIEDKDPKQNCKTGRIANCVAK